MSLITIFFVLNGSVINPADMTNPSHSKNPNPSIQDFQRKSSISCRLIKKTCF